MQTGDTGYIYKNDLDKACFRYDMAHGKYKDLKKRTQSDKVLRDKAFQIASNPKYDGYQRRLVSTVYKFFDKKSKGTGIKNEINNLRTSFISQLLESLKNGKCNSSFKGDIWGIDLADMQLIIKCNKGIRYLLCIIYLFSKYG